MRALQVHSEKQPVAALDEVEPEQRAPCCVNLAHGDSCSAAQDISDPDSPRTPSQTPEQLFAWLVSTDAKRMVFRSRIHSLDVVDIALFKNKST